MLLKQTRQELGEVKGSTFTYSTEYLSQVSSPSLHFFLLTCGSVQSVCLVDEEGDRRARKETEKSKWTTKRGFQYPPVKTRKELIQHPKRPHEARIADLQQPFEHFEEQRRSADNLHSSVSSSPLPPIIGFQ
jgi:hypothetical protein